MTDRGNIVRAAARAANAFPLEIYAPSASARVRAMETAILDYAHLHALRGSPVADTDDTQRRVELNQRQLLRLARVIRQSREAPNE